jgi:broad specificity phosphatase PhoE
MISSRGLGLLYLARNGETRADGNPLLTGWRHPVLSPGGVEQSHALAECLRHVHLDAVVTSRSLATMATAAPTAEWHGLQPECVPAFDAFRMGVLEGREPHVGDAEALALWQQWGSDPWGFEVPGGESLDAFADRVLDAFTAVGKRYAGRRVLLVAHSTTNRIILGTLLGWRKNHWPQIAARHNHLYRIAFGHDRSPVETIMLGGVDSGVTLEGFVS